MPAPGPHAAAVNADDELLPTENLRELRLALDMIHIVLPMDSATSDFLGGLHERLCAEEDEELRSSGVPDRYLIIRPVSLFNPPSPQDMEKITAAVRTLASLGMLAGRGDER